MRVFRAEPSHWFRGCDQTAGLIDSLLAKQQRQEPGFYQRMFNEDFELVFRSMNHRPSNLFEVVSNDDQLLKKLLGNVNERIQELVKEIAQSLIWSGKAYYYLYEDTDTERKGIQIASFGPVGVVRLFGVHIQWVPKRKERWSQDNFEPSREVRILDSDKVMYFDLPRSLESMLSAQKRTLAVIDKYKFDETFLLRTPPTYENPTPVNHFDVRVWDDIQKHALHRATLGTGWDGRDSNSPNRSDFFICHRLIRFRRNQFFLRDNIVNQLSRELSRVGKSYTPGFCVEISGTDELPNIAHLNELEMRLEREEVSFSEITNYCFNH